jgi:hypothetical protein
METNSKQELATKTCKVHLLKDESIMTSVTDKNKPGNKRILH